MSTHRHIDLICLVVLVLTVALTVLFINGEKLGISVIPREEDETELFSPKDEDGLWDTSDATLIELSDEKILVKGNGAYALDRQVTIVYAGKYVLSGELSDGSITVRADGDDKVFLMLDGVNIRSSSDAALKVEQADKVFLTLADGSENSLSSGEGISETAEATGVDGVIYSRDDLTVNGSGSLKIESGSAHGIVCNDDLILTGGTLDITAKDDGIHAHDSVRIKNASVTVSAGDDGITAGNDEQTSFIYIESGDIDIKECYEGIEAVTVTVAGGNVDICCRDDGLNANGRGGSSLISITGGNIRVTNTDGRDADGFDSNGSIRIDGGSILISVSSFGGSSALDYGSENGGECLINGGTLIACGSTVMAEKISESSAQDFIMTELQGKAGETLCVKNAEGETVLSSVIPAEFSLVTVSSPEIKLSGTYTLSAGEIEKQVTVDDLSIESSFGGGGGGNKRFDGERPGEKPDGEESPNGQPPEKPDGEESPNGQPPEKPDGEERSNGQPPEKPDGENFKGEQPSEKPNDSELINQKTENQP